MSQQPHGNSWQDAFKPIKRDSKTAKFDQPGATVAGTITDIGNQFQATKFNRNPQAPKELDYWPSGDPIMQVPVTVQTQERDSSDPEDTGKRTIYMTVSRKEGGQLAAVIAAVEAAGQEYPQVGGFLALSMVGYDPESGNPQNPRKMYQAQYRPPAPGGGAFAPQQAQQAPAPGYQQQPQPAQQGYQPVAAAGPAYAAAPQQVQQAYQPPVQINPQTGEVLGGQQAAPQQFQQQAPTPAYQQPQQAAPQQAQPAQPVQPAPAQQQSGQTDAATIRALIQQGHSDQDIQSATGADPGVIAAIRNMPA